MYVYHFIVTIEITVESIFEPCISVDTIFYKQYLVCNKEAASETRIAKHTFKSRCCAHQDVMSCQVAAVSSAERRYICLM